MKKISWFSEISEIEFVFKSSLFILSFFCYFLEKQIKISFQIQTVFYLYYHSCVECPVLVRKHFSFVTFFFAILQLFTYFCEQVYFSEKPFI